MQGRGHMKWVRHVQGCPRVLVTFASLIQACKSHQYSSERAKPFPTGSGKIPPAMQGEVSVPCMYQDCGNRAGAGAHVVGGLLHGQPGMACQASGCPTTWGGERAEPFPTGSGKIPPAMQGEVSVPCLDQDCGNRAGAGAHVVGGLLHVYLLQVQRRATMHARIRCTHVID